MPAMPKQAESKHVIGGVASIGVKGFVKGTDPPRSESIHVRLNDKEVRLLAKAAYAANCSPAQLIRRMLYALTSI